MKKSFLPAVASIFLFSTCVFSQTPLADSLTNVIQKLPADTSRLNPMYDLSREFVINGEYEKANQKIDEFDSFIEKLSSASGKDKAVQDKLKSEKARALNLRGVIYSRKADFKKALEYYLQALKIREEINDAQGIAMTCNNLSGLYSNLGDEENKLKYLELALKNFEAAGDKKGLGQAYYNQSYYYYQHTDYEKAIELNLKSQKYAEEIDDKIGVTHSLLLTGDIYREMGHLKESNDYFRKALAMCNETGDKVTMMYALGQLGITYEKTGDFQKAYEHHMRALQMGKELDDKKNVANTYGNIAFLFDAIREDYLKKGDAARAAATLDSCARYTFLAKQLYEETGIKEGLPLILLRCGIISLERKKFADAHKYFNETLELATELGNNDQRMWAYKYFSDLYAATNENAKALDYYRLYSNLKDSILNETNSKAINELNTRFETEKKEQQIKLLQKDNEVKSANEIHAKQIRNFSFAGIILLVIFGSLTFYRYIQRKKLSEQLSASLTELKQTQSQLIETERQREQEKIRLRISRDIHDEIGGNLTKIALLSEITSSETKSNGTETKHSLDQISEYARAVNTSLSEIIWSVNPQQDTLESLVAYMRNFIHSFLQDTGINFKIDFPDNISHRMIHPDFKRTLFLILKETLNNCVKHSEAKNIEIKLHLVDDHFEFAVKDDGKGFDLSAKSFLGNGLNNMEYRIKQFDGNFKIHSFPEKGCEIEVSGNLI